MYQATLAAARKLDPAVDLVLDTTARDVDWLRHGRSLKTGDGKMKMKATQEHLEFLDGLRETGVTNMFGAASHLRQEFPALGKQDARKVLVEWMESFSKRHPQDQERRSDQ